MNLEKVIFGFFIVLSLTLNVGFVLGEYNNPEHHSVFEFFSVVVVNLIATALKFGDSSHIGAVLLATSLVAVCELLTASFQWAYAVHIVETGVTPEVMSSIVFLASGALVANIISVVILVAETLMSKV